MNGLKKTADALGQDHLGQVCRDDRTKDAAEKQAGLSAVQPAVHDHSSGDADPEEKGKGIDGVDEKAFQPE